MLRSPQKRETQAGGPGSSKDEKLFAGGSLLPSPSPAVNPDSSHLWSVFRRYARNHRRIARLVAENEGLLERMRQIQGASV